MTPKSRIVVSKPARYSQGEWQHHIHDHDNVNDDDHDTHVLNLMMICCEERSPYGPAADTANMFLDLLGAAYERYHSKYSAVNQKSLVAAAEEKSNSTQQQQQHQQQQKQSKDYTIRITVYHAQSMDYPKTTQEWNSYHGIIIPGSFSTAYDTKIEWIHRLMTVIQNEIHAKRRKTLGVCFGHQCFAHSFGFLGNDLRQRSNNNNNQNSIEIVRTCCNKGGEAATCSIGPIAGRKSFPLTAEGKFLFGTTASSSSNHSDNNSSCTLEKDKIMLNPLPGSACLEMLYTRGDMVQSVPSVGITLCGDEELANEACAYFASEEDLLQFRNHVTNQQLLEDSQLLATSRGDAIDSRKRMSNDGKIAIPYAITLQAHPEFMSPTTRGKEKFINCVNAMVGHGAICHDTAKLALEEATLYHDTLLNDSLDTAISVGVVLGWF